MPLGTLHAIGLGPGDPDLLTLRARTCLEQARTVFAPVRRVGGRSFALDIVEGLLMPSRQRVEVLPFPAGERGWDEYGERIVASLAQGDAAFLTEGDPLFYGSFIGMLAALRAEHPSVSICVVPGVASPMAAAAVAGVPLVDDDQRLAVLPAMHAMDILLGVLQQFDTVVMLKVAPVLIRVLDLLDETGLGQQALHVRRVGRPEQTITFGSTAIRAAPAEVVTDYFSLLIVQPGTHRERSGLLATQRNTSGGTSGVVPVGNRPGGGVPHRPESSHRPRLEESAR